MRFPSAGTGGTPGPVSVSVQREGDAQPVFQKSFQPGEGEKTHLLTLPRLTEGTYDVQINGKEGPALSGHFLHKDFPWLGNTLGKSAKVYAPFTPVKVQGATANVVLRSYKMNGFGLWNSVQSEGKEILAAPIALHLDTGGSETRWTFGKGKWIARADRAAVCQSEASAPGVRVQATSRIEFDGCMRVEMKLLPDPHPKEISHLWLEIPIKDREAPLFHYYAISGNSRSYAGQTPRGGKIQWGGRPDLRMPPRWSATPGSDDGLLWTNHDIRTNIEHFSPNDFVSYIWLGGGERGVAFFAANDKGYSLDDARPFQTVQRQGGQLTLRVDLINTPTRLTAPRQIVFGLQASPTRPMPMDWRNNMTVPPHPGGAEGWGGYIPADKYPAGRDFRVVDEIMKVRKTGTADETVFERLDRERPDSWKKIWGTDPWRGRVLNYFVQQAHWKHQQKAGQNILYGQYPERVSKHEVNSPMETYFEEHASDITQEEWEVYQDEWRAMWPWPERQEVKGQPQPDNNGKAGWQAFPQSYRDFALYYANEWFKRGVGLYFDNTVPYFSLNPHQSDAFYDAKGRIHPACTIWEQRDYYQRIWTLMQQWKEKGAPAPLALTQHMTNAMVLPFNTWDDANLDLEWRWYGEGKGASAEAVPFPPELLLAETTGRQTGSFGNALYGLTSTGEELEPTDAASRTEWGMRVVHEILRKPVREPGKRLEKALWDFGYGTEECRVVNYWLDDPPVQVNDPQTKWLLLARKKDRALFLVLQSWQKSDAALEVTLDTRRLGFTPALAAKDVETGVATALAGTSLLRFKVTLAGPYGTKAIRTGPPTAGPGTLPHTVQ